MLVEGNIEILLKDKDDNIIEKIEGKNTLTISCIEDMLYSAIQNKNSLNTETVKINPFGRLNLLNKRLEDNPKLKGIPFTDKDIVGYAYTGIENATSILKEGVSGNLTTEYNPYNNLISLVYNFGFNKGNGVFNSMCFTNSGDLIDENNPLVGYNPVIIEELKLTNFNTYWAIYKQGNMYVLQDCNIYKVDIITVGNKKELRVNFDTQKEIEQLHDMNIKGFLYSPMEGKYVIFHADYILKLDSNFNYLEKLDIPDGLWDLGRKDNKNYLTYFKGFLFYINNDDNLVKLDIEYNKLDTMYLNSNYRRVFNTFSDSDYLYIYAEDSDQRQCYLTLDVDFNLISKVYVRYSPFREFIHINTNDTFTDSCFLNIEPNNRDICYLSKVYKNINTIYNLKEPVSKTSAKSMQIKYQFSFLF